MNEKRHKMWLEAVCDSLTRVQACGIQIANMQSDRWILQCYKLANITNEDNMDVILSKLRRPPSSPLVPPEKWLELFQTWKTLKQHFAYYCEVHGQGRSRDSQTFLKGILKWPLSRLLTKENELLLDVRRLEKTVLLDILCEEKKDDPSTIAFTRSVLATAILYLEKKLIAEKAEAHNLFRKRLQAKIQSGKETVCKRSLRALFAALPSVASVFQIYGIAVGNFQEENKRPCSIAKGEFKMEKSFTGQKLLRNGKPWSLPHEAVQLAIKQVVSAEINLFFNEVATELKAEERPPQEPPRLEGLLDEYVMGYVVSRSVLLGIDETPERVAKHMNDFLTSGVNALSFPGLPEEGLLPEPQTVGESIGIEPLIDLLFGQMEQEWREWALANKIEWDMAFPPWPTATMGSLLQKVSAINEHLLLKTGPLAMSYKTFGQCIREHVKIYVYGLARFV